MKLLSSASRALASGYRCCTVRYRQMAPMSDLSMSDVVVDFSASMQSLGALQEAAYRLIGQAACHIDEADGRYVCRLSPSQPQLQGDELRSHFLNLVTDENLREKVRRETDRLRDVIVALAFGSLAEERLTLWPASRHQTPSSRNVRASTPAHPL